MEFEPDGTPNVFTKKNKKLHAVQSWHCVDHIFIRGETKGTRILSYVFIQG